jgi:hypothetical protein
MIESVKRYVTGARKRGPAGIGAFYTGDMDLSIAGRNAIGRRQEESGMLERGDIPFDVARDGKVLWGD